MKKLLPTEGKFEVLNCNQAYKMLLNQATTICRSGFYPEIIVGVSRGGWFPARVLSDLLENSNLDNVRVESYIGINKPKNEPILTQSLSMPVVGKKVLVVDEVADSGRSIKIILDYILKLGAVEVKTATLFCKGCCKSKPDYFEKLTDRWVIFPWELKETLRLIYDADKNNLQKMKIEVMELQSAGFPNWLIKHFLKEFSEGPLC